MLEELGEVQPLDHLDWFVPGEKLGQRLERLPAMWSGGGPIGQGTRRLMSAVKKALDPEDLEAWRGETHAKVGAALINLILGTCTVDLPGRGPGGEPRAVPAFWHRLELAADGSASASSRGAGGELLECGGSVPFLVYILGRQGHGQGGNEEGQGTGLVQGSREPSASAPPGDARTRHPGVMSTPGQVHCAQTPVLSP